VVEVLPVDREELVEFAREIQAIYPESSAEEEEQFIVRLPDKATYHYTENELRTLVC
jgi:hypothetical protein